MTVQITPTIVKFCHQVWQLQANVQLVQQNNGTHYVVTDVTPFHPVSHIWPDHPSDKGSITLANGQQLDVTGCQVGAIELATGALYVGQDIPVKRETDGWIFVVVHCIDTETMIEVNDSVQLNVDKDYQQALSRGHSAGHLSYLALNKVLADGYWRKEADRRDPHGYYDFNSYAQVSSFVTEDKCVDTYRLGKTIRKRGLNSADMLADLSQIEQKVNELLVKWLSLGSPIEVHCEGERLTDSRYWRCDLNEGQTAEIACGGTHVGSLADFSHITVEFNQIDDQHIEMYTRSEAV
ncbi:alanyl-tRNA editing protein [Vibrio sp. S4M6]|uniref:alanyl-tRNA editing protein n=1 Tax=Vibrio sinus TaxID=2946865 RepID=UPI00202A5686|nr:alanyl-tRNA editing protein [Vibrio sinus]MCL9783774.1 alanyl-tRNA editing protein [Vibrio sinus]